LPLYWFSISIIKVRVMFKGFCQGFLTWLSQHFLTNSAVPVYDTQPLHQKMMLQKR
jgi:hypothetical protein